MARINKSISLSNDAMEYAQKQAEALFGGNISGYLNYLVMREKNNIPEEKEKSKGLSKGDKAKLKGLGVEI